MYFVGFNAFLALVLINYKHARAKELDSIDPQLLPKASRGGNAGACWCQTHGALAALQIHWKDALAVMSPTNMNLIDPTTDPNYAEMLAELAGRRAKPAGDDEEASEDGDEAQEVDVEGARMEKAMDELDE